MTRPYEPDPRVRRSPDPPAAWRRPPADDRGVSGPYGDEPQYGWQPEYEPSWGQDHRTPTRRTTRQTARRTPPRTPPRTAQQRGRQRLLVAVVVAVVVVAVLVLGFVAPGWFVTRVFDATAVQAGVVKIFGDDYGTDGVADVRCPQDVQVTTGATFICDATIDGDPVRIPITVLDDRGGYQVGRPA